MVYLAVYMRSRGANQVHVVGSAAGSVAKQRATFYTHSQDSRGKYRTHTHTRITYMMAQPLSLCV